MKASLIYDSITGNTKKLAQAIEEMFEITSVKESEIAFIGSWTDKGEPSQKIKEELSKIENKKIFYFGTCGFGGEESYFALLFERVKKYISPTNEVVGYFYCQGKMPTRCSKKV